MPKPFSCPHCGGHDYVVMLTGCKVTGATLEEAYTWDAVNEEYVSSGSVVVDSETFDSQGAQAVCSNCETDVTDAVSAYESTVAGGQADAAQA